jgi:hypothetical protein
VGKAGARVNRERKTVAAMIAIYCRSYHQADIPCSECAELLIYASERLAKCPFQGGKTVCGKCPVHCFKPAMRERIRTVMRFSGPRMLRRHPIMAIRHFIDRSRGEPVRPHRAGTDSSTG